MDFAKKYGPWAVIAGASEGTGASFARQVAAKGLNLVLIARRQGPLDTLAKEVREKYGVQVVTASIDLAALDAPKKVAAAAGDREVGLFIFNAGADPTGKFFLDADYQAWADLVQRNVNTTMACCYNFAGPMVKRGRGGILLLNSGACYNGIVTMGPYCGSKAFVLCFAEGLWCDLNDKGVDVLTLVMSKTDTPEFRRYMEEHGMPFPSDAASADDVAALGLERLPHGPIQNWGEKDDEAKMTLQSSKARRERAIMINNGTKKMMGHK